MYYLNNPGLPVVCVLLNSPGLPSVLLPWTGNRPSVFGLSPRRQRQYMRLGGRCQCPGLHDILDILVVPRSENSV